MGTTEITRRENSAMELLAEVQRSTEDPLVKIEVAKKIADLQIQLEEFNWRREERQARIDFDDKLNECQSQIERIAPNAKRQVSKKSDALIWWADYAQLDRNLRPIYIKAGFSIAFSEEPSPAPGYLRMKAVVSRGGISKEFFSTAPIQPANEFMSLADGYASAQSRAQRYILLDIFNVAVGIDKDEKKPFEEQKGMPAETLQEWIDCINQCDSTDAVRYQHNKAWEAANALDDQEAIKRLLKVKDVKMASFARRK